MSEDATTKALQDRRNDSGQVRVWDVPQSKYVYVWAPDAREMIAKGTALMDEPKAAAAAAAPAAPSGGVGGVDQLDAEKLRAMDGPQLHELAVAQGIKNLQKMSREEILAAIAKKHGIALPAN